MKTRKSFWATGLSSKCYSPGEGPPEGKPISLCCTEGRNIVGMRKLEEREKERERVLTAKNRVFALISTIR